VDYRASNIEKSPLLKHSYEMNSAGSRYDPTGKPFRGYIEKVLIALDSELVQRSVSDKKPIIVVSMCVIIPGLHWRTVVSTLEH
jgi:hypothetical protein